MIANRKVLIAPSKYVQGRDALIDLAGHLVEAEISNPLVLGGPRTLATVEPLLRKSFEGMGMKFSFATFGGECTWNEIYRVRDLCIEGGHDAIVACGGGKSMDTGRASAAGSAIDAGIVPPRIVEKLGAGVPCIQVPTIASTDAATARACLVYSEKGVFETVLIARSNPLMVVADTGVIARAPVRTLVAGMGDALSTYFESSICHRTGSQTHAGGFPTRTALMMGRLAFDILMEYGLQAKTENEAGIAGPALEAVVEANILLSGLGYESGGLAAAHAVADTFTVIKHRFASPFLHGEVVAFGTLTHLMMEERNREFLDRILNFCVTVGLPVTFEEMGLRNPTDEELSLVAEAASKDPLIRSMPKANKEPDEMGRFYDPLEILNCMKAADACGRSYKKMHGK